MEVVRYIFL